MKLKKYSAHQVIQDREKGLVFLRELIKTPPKDTKELEKMKRAFCAKHGTTPFLNRELVVLLDEMPGKEDRQKLEKILTKRAVRTISGVTPIGILTKPFPCPGQCVYCPTEARMPKSYLSSQPAAARALRNKFHPYKQVHNRIIACQESGHPTSKLEVIVMGGTWSFLPHKYQSWYVRNVFKAANEMSGDRDAINHVSTLRQEQKINETADHRVIGLTLETRPDWITEEELVRMRKLGCTRIEIGVQTLDDTVSKNTKRGHYRKHVAQATKLMREYGFKFCYHLMPGLPGSTPENDLQMIREVFEGVDFKPDFVKIYPCQVLPNSELADWWKDGKFKPLDDAALVKLLLKMKEFIPPWTRVMRLLRDIPVGDTLDGVKFSNLRQIMKKQPKKLRELLGEKDFFEIAGPPRRECGVGRDGEDGANRASEKQMRDSEVYNVDWPCQCIRCREVGFQNHEVGTPILKRRDYEAAGGTETFLSFESEDEKVLYALLRLRKPETGFKPKYFRSVLKNAALIREVHSYGSEISVGDETGVSRGQHKGLGKRLIAEAERIAKEEWGLKKMTIIAGVGTREYYRKFGYEARCTYMTKKLN